MKAPSSKSRHHRGIREGTARPGAGSSASAELRRQGRSGVRVGGAGGARWMGPGAGTGTEGLAVPFGRPWGAGRPDVRGGRVPGHRRARKPGPRCSRGGASPTLPAAAQTCCPRPASVSLSRSSSGASRPGRLPRSGQHSSPSPLPQRWLTLLGGRQTARRVRRRPPRWLASCPGAGTWMVFLLQAAQCPPGQRDVLKPCGVNRVTTGDPDRRTFSRDTARSIKEGGSVREACP